MTDTAIRVENLSKQYRIGGPQDRFPTLRDKMANAVAAPFRRLSSVVRGGSSSGLHETIWALKDVSFEVKRGEVVGIIGRNGAGKTTLLKILSRITKPTEGYAEVHGRVGSLLEVGTGFHPELTGRENITLNGAILGMKRAEIDRKFDEIVAFAEIEKFMNTPVKHYSSGMYVRLAFAVAAHLEPEILLVDEVLAVGDAVFQKKCLGKMEDVAKAGRTVLFVSHNMAAVTQLCQRAIVFVNGAKGFDGPSAQAVDLYLKMGQTMPSRAEFEIDANKPLQFTSVAVESIEGELVNQIDFIQSLTIAIRYRVLRWKPGAYVCLGISNGAGIRVLWSADVNNTDGLLLRRSPGDYLARVEVPGQVLACGTYYCSVAIYAPGRQQVLDVRENVASFEVVDNRSLLAQFSISHQALTTIPMAWRTHREQISID